MSTAAATTPVGSHPVPATTPHRGQKSATRHSRWMGWAFVGPFMVIFLLMIGAPILYALYMSLFQDKLVGGTTFVGLANYVTLMGDAQFWEGARRVLVFFVIQVPLMLFLALIAALAIDSVRLRGRGFFRIMLFLPYAVPGVVAVLIWGFMYGDQVGLMKYVNSFLHTSIDPLSSQLILFAMANIQGWCFMGYNMLIMYSGLKTIPNDLYEAAEIDGAGSFQIVRAIKIPAIRGQILISFIFSIIGSLQLFNEPNLLKPLRDGVITSYYTPNMYAYNLAMNGQQFNYSATVALVMGVMTAIIAYVVQTRSMKSEA